ncbi:MAG TPA: DNA replication/repair protein RecF [Rhodanobacteraceae bacterium]|nr:DNA replication/repair protein RecF [Rhodanobacteraceae bacterium]
MKIDLLHVESLRCFESLSLAPGPGLNWLLGRNGAGKTSILEAAYILSRGHSFRTGGRSAPCRHGSKRYLIHATLTRSRHAGISLGLVREGDRWEARRDGESLGSLAPLFEACPVVYFGPESPQLVVGPADGRRSFLDWSVFHVEHTSLDLWRRWRRALRQRNALLRSDAPTASFEPWEHELARVADAIDGLRQACVATLGPCLGAEAAWLVPELGAVSLEYRPGWDTGIGLQRQLAEQRSRDRERGFTQSGAHRADWLLRFERVASKDHLSRGQAKSVALAYLLGQTRWLRDRIGEFPLLCLDDLESELDAEHAARVVAWLSDKPLQVWLTATETPDAARRRDEARMFHVEHEGVTPA